MAKLDFKYTSRFDIPIRTVYASSQGDFVSTASLEELKSLAGNSQDIKTNYDLLYNAFNAAVINRINKNHDGIEASTIVKVHKNFIHKPQNIEHNRNLIVGHIISTGFSEFLSNKVMSEAEAAAATHPFYLNLGAVVYKVADPELAEILIEAADETSPNYKKVCASWEMGFNEYKILLGHRDLAEGELISDQKQVEAFSKYLKVYGGSGQLDDGTAVYRVLSGDVLPLGCGYTTTPAAEVEGVFIHAKDEEAAASAQPEEREVIVIQSQEPEPENIVEDTQSSPIEQNNEELQNISSQTNIQPVKIISIMRREDINDTNLPQLSAASINSFISEEIDRVSNEYAVKLDKATEEANLKATEATEAQNTLAEVKAEFDRIKEELEQVKVQREAEKAQADFSSRMSALNEKYNLTDKDQEAITKRIRGMDDEAYSAWFNEEFSILAEQKVKTAQASQQAVASVEEVLDDAQPNPDQPSIPNGGDTTSAKASWAEAFKLEDIVGNKRR